MEPCLHGRRRSGKLAYVMALAAPADLKEAPVVPEEHRDMVADPKTKRAEQLGDPVRPMNTFAPQSETK